MIPSRDLRTGLAWSRLARGRRARALCRLLGAVETASRVLELSPAEAARIAGESEDVVAPLLAPDLASTDADLRRLEASGARLIFSSGIAEYPGLVREITDPPPLLFARGARLPSSPAIALVGARRASRVGLEVAAVLARGLAAAGVAVVSGFARGVDAAAHRAALEAGGTDDRGLRVRRRRLLSRRSSAAFSRTFSPAGPRSRNFRWATTPSPGIFRCATGSSRASRGSCASWRPRRRAAPSSRRAAPGVTDATSRRCRGRSSPLSRGGSNALLKDGAILVRTADDLLAELPDEDRRRLNVAVAARTAAARPDLPPDAAVLLAVLDPDEPREADALIGAAGLDAARFSAALLHLETRGSRDGAPGGSLRPLARPGLTGVASWRVRYGQVPRHRRVPREGRDAR